MTKTDEQPKPNTGFDSGLLTRQSDYPLISNLADQANYERNMNLPESPRFGKMRVSVYGRIYYNSHVRLQQDHWLRLGSICLLHLGLSHFRRNQPFDLWSLACDLIANQLLEELAIGRHPNQMELPEKLPTRDLNDLFEFLKKEKFPDSWQNVSPGGKGIATLVPFPKELDTKPMIEKWEKTMRISLSETIESTMEVAAIGKSKKKMTSFQKAKRWVLSQYPLLGGICAGMEWVEDERTCIHHQISVAAVDIEAKRLFFNPKVQLTEKEAIFVLGHELLHAALRHDLRGNGRDPFFWNIACDFVINSWLIEMGFGEMPKIGGLFDNQFVGLSAEAVYDRIIGDLRRFRKLSTFRGPENGDLIQGTGTSHSIDRMNLDQFYRQVLSQGLIQHRKMGIGNLPGQLEEEILARSHPPIPWDVDLANWLDRFIKQPESIRTYARMSRRQSASPSIPLPGRVHPEEESHSRTFGVLLDTSGSMNRKALSKALGAIASYAESRDVSRIRLMFCDVQVYDEGYVTPEQLSVQMKVKGRGGTKLQPAINYFHSLEDFPLSGPLLIITDGLCDPVAIPRQHAFLMPTGTQLPFFPVGQVFWMDRE